MEGFAVKVSLIQMNTRDDKASNLQQAKELIEAAVGETRPDLVVLPETFAFMGATEDRQRETAEEFPSGEAYRLMQDLASRHAVFIHAGSMIERVNDQYYNTTVVFDQTGKEVARYRKIHLFDVVTPGGLSYRESALLARGSDIVTYTIGKTKVGCSICYDIRFAELYRALAQAGAQIIVIPAAFTMETGKDHWEILCRARAIETQTYVLAPNQVGQYPSANSMRACFGHTMVVDPWGHIIAQAQDKPGFISARLDLPYLTEIRRDLPVHQHHVLP
jgi:nitrilase